MARYDDFHNSIKNSRRNQMTKLTYFKESRDTLAYLWIFAIVYYLPPRTSVIGLVIGITSVIIAINIIIFIYKKISNRKK